MSKSARPPHACGRLRLRPRPVRAGLLATREGNESQRDTGNRAGGNASIARELRARRLYALLQQGHERRARQARRDGLQHAQHDAAAARGTGVGVVAANDAGRGRTMVLSRKGRERALMGRRSGCSRARVGARCLPESRMPNSRGVRMARIPPHRLPGTAGVLAGLADDGAPALHGSAGFRNGRERASRGPAGRRRSQGNRTPQPRAASLGYPGIPEPLPSRKPARTASRKSRNCESRNPGSGHPRRRAAPPGYPGTPGPPPSRKPGAAGRTGRLPRHAGRSPGGRRSGRWIDRRPRRRARPLDAAASGRPDPRREMDGEGAAVLGRRREEFIDGVPRFVDNVHDFLSVERGIGMVIGRIWRARRPPGGGRGTRTVLYVDAARRWPPVLASARASATLSARRAFRAAQTIPGRVRLSMPASSPRKLRDGRFGAGPVWRRSDCKPIRPLVLRVSITRFLHGAPEGVSPARRPGPGRGRAGKRRAAARTAP